MLVVSADEKRWAITRNSGLPTARNADKANLMAATLELDNLTVDLGSRRILDGLAGTLKGRAIGLLGPNGSGKSTLINTLLGFYKTQAGSARVLGCDIHRDLERIRSIVGYMPENDAFIARMSGVDFVRYMAELSGLPAAAALERA